MNFSFISDFLPTINLLLIFIIFPHRRKQSPRERNRRAQGKDSTSAGRNAERHIRGSRALELDVESQIGGEPPRFDSRPKRDGLHAEGFPRRFN